MPPKCKFTKDEIINVAVELVRLEGMGALTARSLAQSLGTSTKPIFGLFENMQQVQEAVLAEANERYLACLLREQKTGLYPAYKLSGMGYIRFAMEEKELFKLLFMRNRTGEAIEDNRESIAPQLDMIQSNLGIDRESAYPFHLEMWHYVHGIATMIATDYLHWELDFISTALTDAYQGLRHRINMLYCLLFVLPISLFYIGMGLLCGSVLNVKQVGGICGALFTNLSAWLSGTWFDLDLVGGTFRKIAYALPFVHAVDLERAVLAGNWQEILPHLAWVLGYAIAINLMAIFLFLRQMKRQ